MVRRAAKGSIEKPAGGEDAANERERRGRFFRAVSMALRATKVNEIERVWADFRRLFACSSTERLQGSIPDHPQELPCTRSSRARPVVLSFLTPSRPPSLGWANSPPWV